MLNVNRWSHLVAFSLLEPGHQPAQETGGILAASLGQPGTFPRVRFCSLLGARLFM